MPAPSRKLELGLALCAILAGAAVAFSTLGRGVWLDEFWTLFATRPEFSFADFIAQMKRDVHPLLHYGLVFGARELGLNDIVSLRLLNLLGAALLGLGFWRAHASNALSFAQLCILVVLTTTSPILFSTFAEARAYFLLYCASIAVALLWVMFVRQAEQKRPLAWPDLLAWTVCLSIFVNLHYFATLFGGVLCAALIWRIWREVGKNQALVLAGLSALAAAPAIWLFILQMQGADRAIVAWVATGRIDAIYVMAKTLWESGGANIVAFACGIVALLQLANDRRNWSAAKRELILLGVIAIYLALLLVLNAARPMVTDRYLIAMSGAVCVVLALLAGRENGLKWAVSAICVWAVALSFRAWHDDLYAREGWRQSAAAVRDIMAVCPSTQVFIDPSGDTPQISDFVGARRLGQLYYAARFGFRVTEVAPGGHVPAPGTECPNVIWLEHIQNVEDVEARDLLARLRLEAEGHGDVLVEGSGALIVLH